ncbi:MAG: InlB B-repeat-containing protein [Lachnospiraceae bacterium]
MFVSILLGFVMLLSVSSKTLRENELRQELAAALDLTIRELALVQDDGGMSQEEFISIFMQSLISGIHSESDLKVEILSADPEMGILSADVLMTYSYPNGKIGRISELRTIILDREIEFEPVNYTVTYLYPTGDIYKQYGLEEGSHIPKPKDPARSGQSFLGWTNETGNAQTFLTETGDVTGVKREVATDQEGSAVILHGDRVFTAKFN